jgi:hypothetical protein
MSGSRTGRLMVAAAFAGVAGALLASALIWLVNTRDAPASDLHHRLHAHVTLSGDEKRRMAAREAAFEARRAAIEQRMKAANGRLARAIGTDPRWSPEVEAATREVEVAAGELERATLQHVFEMRNDLDPAHRPAYDKVLQTALAEGAK